MAAQVPRLSDYFVSETHGFLLERSEEPLPSYYEPWEDMALRLVELLSNKTLRQCIHCMPTLELTQLQCYQQHRRAYMLLTFLCNGYIWQDGDSGVQRCLPRQIALPLCGLSDHLGLKPALSHASVALSNWELIDASGPFVAENLRTICQFQGGRQFEWFVLVTVEVEKTAIPGIKAAVDGLQGALEGNEILVLQALKTIAQTLIQMKLVLKKMYNGLESHVFFDTFRPFLSGWGGEGNALPDGLIYEDVSGQPIKVSGGSAAQSTTIVTFDAVLGVQHDLKRRQFLDSMLDYMPRSHREFVLALRAAPSLRNFVFLKERDQQSELVDAYNACIKALTDFRSEHIQLVTKYIIIPSRRRERKKDFEGVANKGTGGTSLIPFLQSLRNSSKEAKLQ